MPLSGRYALALALEHIGLRPDDAVLLPAYHCEAMIAPVKCLCATPVFYAINPDTSIKLDDVKHKITPQIKVIVVTHYFGFIQDLTAIRALCDQHGIKLIEDCAHAFFGRYKNQRVGKVGDYAIASTMKFLPVYEGGLLCSETINLTDVKVTVPGISFQLKSLINSIEKSIAYKRLGIVGKCLKVLLGLKNTVWMTLKKLRPSSGVSQGPSSSDGGYGLDEAWVHKGISLFSRLIISQYALNDSAYRRREIYQKLHAALAPLPNSRALFESLPDQIVPWVYPLYVDYPQQSFIELKMQGIPIWRFGEFLDAQINVQVCSVSIDYSRHIFQFPCHQSLTDQEVDWMIACIAHTLSKEV
ncbi:conserved hypothetical protein [Crenothrix polyspora]|uniref:DegT/DnrJ/EryC1/StrS aminotransferase n=2 Tax=Crenothrix polyspora TaxID=360316 RepID=A0A1R4H329_9GAMM|nr:conserved hypothetical protein [Crenothrix polyspora]